jgi:hypothetical protein
VTRDCRDAGGLTGGALRRLERVDLREEALEDPALWTAGEWSKLQAAGGSLGVDRFHWVCVEAMARRVRHAEAWFPGHLDRHGPEWVRTGPDGAEAPVRVETLADLRAQVPATRVECFFRERSIAFQSKERRSLRTWWATRRQPAPVWEFRPLHCDCTMPGRIARASAS